MIETRLITNKDDLNSLVAQINQGSWDEANGVTKYDVASLASYLGRQGTVFVACYQISHNGKNLLGVASARLEIKPYNEEQWLYIDEVDVCADKRQQGAGKAMMRKLLELAHDEGCTEVWLGTEPDNLAANALYESLEPDEIEKFVGYTYKARR